MAAPESTWLVLKDLRGGRNGHDAPDALQDNECADAVNVEWNTSTFGQTRGGANTLAMANSTSGNIFAGTVSSLHLHAPSVDDTQVELWAMDDSATPAIARLANGVVWELPTLKDAPTGNGWQFSTASLDGKFFIAYQSAVNRLHVWDGSTVRRAGLAAPAAPSVADTGSGSYAATARYYRIRYTIQDAGITILTSEPSTGTLFTPSGSGTAARVTKPAAINEGETHWVVEGSLDDATYFELSTIAVATTTYDDSAATSTYADGTLSATVGSYTLQKPYRFIRTDAGRLLGFGSYNASDPQNRIEFSDIVGGGTIWASEITPSGNNYVALTERAAGGPTALIGPVNGSFFAFLYRQVWKLTPTGNPLVPYQLLCISPTVGCVGPDAVVLAEDEVGNPCLYWMSHRGVYRWAGGALQYIGNGVEDLILGTNGMNTLAAKVICHAVYHPDKRQVWFYYASNGADEPNAKIIWHIGRVGGTSPSDHPVPSGWSRDTGESVKARASVMFSETVGSMMSRTQLPYIAYSNAVNSIWRCDTADLDDNGTAFKAFITSKAFQPWETMHTGRVGRTYVQAVAANTTLQETINGDFGVTSKQVTANATLAATGSETRVFRPFKTAGLSGLSSVQFTWGHAVASNTRFEIDKVLIETAPEGDV